MVIYFCVQYGIKWSFAKVIERAKLACKNSGFEVDDHFPEVKKMVEVGALQKKVIDYKKWRKK